MTTSIGVRIDDDGRPYYLAAPGDQRDRTRAAALAAEARRRALAEVEAEAGLSWFAKAFLAMTATVIIPLIAGQIAGTATVMAAASRFKKERDRINGILEIAEINAAIRTIRIAHVVLRISSENYRSQLERLYGATRQLSRSVFGDATTITSAMSLYSMVVYDITSLLGQPVEVAETKVFNATYKVANQIERNSRTYARNPGAFWAWMTESMVRPVANEAQQERRNQRRVVTLLGRSMTAVEGALTGTNQRFNEYRQELNPFLSTEKLRELDTIRRSWNADVLVPLRQLRTLQDVTFPGWQDRLQAVDATTLEQAKEINALTEITADSTKLTETAKARQRERLTTWADNIASAGGTPDERAKEAGDTVKSIFDRIGPRRPTGL